MRVSTPLATFAVCLALTSCDSAGSPPRANLSPTAISARVRVTVVEAAPGELDDLGDATGVVQPFTLARVAASVGGRVDARHVDRGDAVEAGDLLVELDASRARIQVRQADATLDARTSDEAQATRDRERADRLRERQSLSPAEHERLTHQAESAGSAADIALLGKRAASDAVRDSKVKAPFAGTIADFHVEVGEFVGPGTPVVTLVDLTRVRIRVGVTASDAGELRIGDTLDVTFTEANGRTLLAVLHSISSLSDPRSGMYIAELWLDNTDGRLRQGMVGRVALKPSVTERSAPERVVIPRAALMRRQGRFSVWVAANGVASAREVQTGRSDTHDIEILDGLTAGEAVVVDGGFALRDGAAVEIESSKAVH